METINKVEHTPLPWKIRFFRGEQPEDGFFIEGPKVDPEAPYNTDILSEDTSFYPLERRFSDAKLIVEACNNHYSLLKQRDELLEALKHNHDFITKFYMRLSSLVHIDSLKDVKDEIERIDSLIKSTDPKQIER